METPHKIKRYPSIRSFEKNEAGLFFGRDLETQQLFNKVLAEREVLLFARSGIGKSSLINAGLIPLLEKRGFLPLPVRLTREAAASALQPDELVRKALEPYYDKLEMPAGYPHTAQLWEYVKCCSFPLGATPVLILDQFEQFFYFTAAEQEIFIRQLAELAQEYEPPRVANWYSDLNEETAKREKAWFAEQPPFKVVIAIRSDRLYEMNRLAEFMPTILRNRYDLQPLRPESAEKAITAPAARQDESLYQSRHFFYSPELKNAIITSLQGGNGNIETTQLQIVCSEIENRILLTAADEPARPAGYEVSLADIQAIGGIGKIIDEFYGNQVAKMGDAVQVAAARAFIENELYDAVNNGRRIVFEEEAKKVIGACAEIKAARGITPDLMLTRLLDLRLIREDLRENRKFYEISHDYLLGAIGKSYQSARAKKEKAEAEQKNDALMAEINKRRKRQRVTYGLLGVSLAAVIVSAVLFQTASRQREKYKDAIGELYAARAKERMDSYDNYQAYNLLVAANKINHTSEHDTLIGLVATELLTGNLKYLGNDIFANLTYDSILYVWNCGTRPFTLLKSFNKPGEYFFSDDGSKLFMLDTNRKVTVWKWGKNKAELHGSFDAGYLGKRIARDSILISDDGSTALYLDSNSQFSGYTFKEGKYIRLPELPGINSFEKTIHKKRILNSTGDYLLYYVPVFSKKKPPSYDVYLAGIKDDAGRPELIAKSIRPAPKYYKTDNRLFWHAEDGTFFIYDLSDKRPDTCTALKKYLAKSHNKTATVLRHLLKGGLVVSYRSNVDPEMGVEVLIITDLVKDTVLQYYSSSRLSNGFYYYSSDDNLLMRYDTAGTTIMNMLTGMPLFSFPAGHTAEYFVMLDSASYVYIAEDSIYIKNTGTGASSLVNYIKDNFKWEYQTNSSIGLNVYNHYYITVTRADKTILFLPHPLTPDSLRNIYPPLRPEEKKQFRID
jgi:hypothetical protein